jgi:hypothetical protein
MEGENSYKVQAVYSSLKKGELRNKMREKI